MSPMPIFIPAPPRKYRERNLSTATPVGAMTLLAAIYQPQTAIRLTFSRAIDTSDVLPDGFNVFDGDSQHQFIGTSYSLVDANTISIELIIIGEYLGAGISLYADASNGIKAVGDGAVWDGVSGLELPFP